MVDILERERTECARVGKERIVPQCHITEHMLEFAARSEVPEEKEDAEHEHDFRFRRRLPRMRPQEVKCFFHRKEELLILLFAGKEAPQHPEDAREEPCLALAAAKCAPHVVYIRSIGDAPRGSAADEGKLREREVLQGKT